MKNKLNGWGTFIAIVISIIALSVSVYEATLLDDQQKLMVWPYLDVSTSYGPDGFSLEAVNKGLGPALVRSVQFEYNDLQYESYNQLFDEINPKRKIGYDLIKISPINKSVFKAGEVRKLLFIPWGTEGDVIINQLHKVKIVINYCSVLDDCWVIKLPSGSRYEGRFNSKHEFKN
ncbi:hypothetical protein [Winogradskyella sp.]